MIPSLLQPRWSLPPGGRPCKSTSMRRCCTAFLHVHAPADVCLLWQVALYVKERVLALRREHPRQYSNIACVRTNTQKYLPNYFRKAQLTKLFFLFPVCAVPGSGQVPYSFMATHIPASTVSADFVPEQKLAFLTPAGVPCPYAATSTAHGRPHIRMQLYILGCIVAASVYWVTASQGWRGCARRTRTLRCRTTGDASSRRSCWPSTPSCWRPAGACTRPPTCPRRAFAGPQSALLFDLYITGATAHGMRG